MRLPNILKMVAAAGVLALMSSAASAVTLNLHNGGDPRTLDPAKESGNWEDRPTSDIMEGMMTIDPKGEPTLGQAASFEVSPDGKYLYQFGPKITILQTTDFKVVDQLDLARPDFPGMENVRLGNDLSLISQPGMHTSIFNSSDPIVHNRVFGLARLDLARRQVTYNPIGPAPGGMAGLQVTPDNQTAYTIVANGAFGNKRCEFWGFDLTTDHLTKTMEVSCRSRFSFGMSSDGKKLYIYGAGFEIEVYDVATLKLEKTWDLQTDIILAGIAVLP